MAARIVEKEALHKFWSKLNELRSSEQEAVSFLENADSSLWHTKDPNSGCSVTEYMCGLEAYPYTRDFLDDLIEEGIPVTTKCYELVLDGNVYGMVSVDTLKSLLDSCYLPKEINEELPLDALTSLLLDEDVSGFDGDAGDIHAFFSITGLKHQVNVTHSEAGPFKKVQEEAKLAAEEREQCDTEQKEKEESSKQESQNQQKGKKENGSPRSVVDSKVKCPVCKNDFATQVEVDNHIRASKGKGHRKYAKKFATNKRKKELDTTTNDVAAAAPPDAKRART